MLIQFCDHMHMSITTSPLTLKTALVTRGHTQVLKDGTVTPRGFALEFEEVPQIIQAFRRMVRGLEFDVSEMAITTYLCARAHGTRFTALPVFPMRAFHHGAVVVHKRNDIRSPKDLEGRKVGVNRGYTVTTGLWARSILQHEHGVDLDRVTWVLSGDEHVAEYVPPPNVVPIEKGKTLEGMLASGEIAAAINIQVDSPDVVPLIPHPEDAGLAALRDRGLYPINHTVVVRDELLAAHPEVGPAIFEAFAEAKRRYAPSRYEPVHRKVAAVIGDPLPYGIDPNRDVLEAVIQHSVEQGILRRPFTVEELFPENTHALTA
jgi:4,5-dihydroxyphthalate decarboxylase